MTCDYVDSSVIRTRFADAMSAMYRQEVPMYGTLLDLVSTVNQQLLQQDETLKQALQLSDNLDRLSQERHGAIRLGSPAELAMMRRLFAVMGMYPVAYYDLTEAGMPVHSTAFRPLDPEQLKINPFRIFTSLLRLDLITDTHLREQAQSLLSQRRIFAPELIELIEHCEAQGGLNAAEADQFVTTALQTFRWHKRAQVDLATYNAFQRSHTLIADIVCFKGPHINHLTPRTLDIDRIQQLMPQHGLKAKPVVEGPPRRRYPILLRQTSFLALSEDIEFIDASGQIEAGSHTARFGEIEQRGMALTPKGRQLYDDLLTLVRRKTTDIGKDPDYYRSELQQIFADFPDDLESIHNQRLAYFSFHANPGSRLQVEASLDQLIKQRILEISPLTYEDFLPVSAAGIFQSNLGDRQGQSFARSPNQDAFEQALGCPVTSEFELYASIQRDSLRDALLQLGVDHTAIPAFLQQL